MSKIAIRNKIASHAVEIIDELLELLHHSNANTRLGAAKILLNKILPDLRAQDICLGSDEKILVKIVSSMLAPPPNSIEGTQSP